MKSNLFSDYQLGYNVGITQKEGNQVVGAQGYFNFDDYLTFIGIPPNDPELRSFFQSNDRNRIRVICVDQNLYLLRKIYQADKPAALYFIVNWKQQNLLDKTSIDYLRGRMYFLILNLLRIRLVEF